MKKLMVIALILASSMIFAQKKGMGNNKGMGFNNMKNLTPEQRFKKMTEAKYVRIKKHLSKKNADIILPIIKKYDNKIFKLMKPHILKAQKIRKSEYANYNAKLKLMETGLNLRIKVLKLKKQEFTELKNSGLSNEKLLKIIKREFHNGMNGMKMRNKHRRMRMRNKHRRGMRGEDF